MRVLTSPGPIRSITTEVHNICYASLVVHTREEPESPRVLSYQRQSRMLDV